MKQLKHSFRSALGFSRAQASGFVLLIALVLGFVFSGALYAPTPQAAEDPEAVRVLDSLLACWNDVAADSAKINTRPFRFDPNKLSIQELQKVGFSPLLAQRMVRYRQAGGVFRSRKDLLRIYGMDTAVYRRLESYIQLPAGRPAPKPKKTWQAYPSVAARKATPFDLNLADTAQLKKIFGIGDKRAMRIVAYREKLGGFVTVAQIGEIYTLDSAVAGRLAQASFVSENFRPRRIDINKAGESELAAHPYLSKSAAQALVAYRFQHGEFSTLSDLAKIQVLDTKTIQKIAPYLEFQIYHHPAPDTDQ
ncbi:helix-hairpin-helix domain-containing protein [Dawidia soli]|uniref:Helix-hairpin-helix domain-containing protein n=1 Tax=Dawidia soli TaxID=2782352 RepID=A0AAP2DE67_9BACT|nr:helix-hairpin-helix domain-containing protein [Dawidia soli]MBT1689516.1 helix-hairpin-helix domain-containing protein [Dawidia soli]